jgi:phage internal scaffolding protein
MSRITTIDDVISDPNVMEAHDPIQSWVRPVIRTAYMPSCRDSDIDFSGTVSLTKQSEAAACDINTIMAQYEKTSLLDHVNQFQGRYEDLGDSVDYHGSMNIVLAAQSAFDSLSAHVRARFDNDPALFLDFVNDPKNLDEMADLGLLSDAALAARSSTSVSPDVGPQEATKEGDTVAS